MYLDHLFFGILIGIFLTLIYVFFRAITIMRELEHLKIKPEIEDKKMRVTVEKTEEMYYCYTVDENVFVCQGRDIGEISKAFALRYPEKLMYIVGGDSQTLDELIPNSA